MDAYDKAVEYLTANPGEIFGTWDFPYGDQSGCLFRWVTPNGGKKLNGVECGCLTEIKHGILPACTPELTLAIKKDKRIPRSSEITPEHLPVFAEWQRRIDKELNREPPVFREV